MKPAVRSPFHDRDDFSGLALRHGSFKSLFQVALYPPRSHYASHFSYSPVFAPEATGNNWAVSGAGSDSGKNAHRVRVGSSACTVFSLFRLVGGRGRSAGPAFGQIWFRLTLMSSIILSSQPRTILHDPEPKTFHTQHSTLIP